MDVDIAQCLMADRDITRCEVDIDRVWVIVQCEADSDTTRCEADCDITRGEADIDRVRVIAQCEVDIILLRGRDGHYFTAWSRWSGSRV